MLIAKAVNYVHIRGRGRGDFSLTLGETWFIKGCSGSALGVRDLQQGCSAFCVYEYGVPRNAYQDGTVAGPHHSQINSPWHLVAYNR